MSHALALADWQSFYVLMGSSAAALTGLTFVVVTVAGDKGELTGSASARLSGLRVFITPTAVHFGAALWLSGLMCIPGWAAVFPIGSGAPRFPWSRTWLWLRRASCCRI